MANFFFTEFAFHYLNKYSGLPEGRGASPVKESVGRVRRWELPLPDRRDFQQPNR